MAAFNRYKLAHVTLFSYDGTVSESYNELRLRPRHDESQSCLSFRLTTVPFSKPAAHLDYFNNWVHQFHILPEHKELRVESEAIVLVHPQLPFVVRTLPLAELDAMQDTLADEYFDWMEPSQYCPRLPALAEILSEALSARIIREAVEENPFLGPFYKDRRRHAMSAQLFFLLQRYAQQGELAQGDLFSRGGVVSDYLFAKDRLFATLNLSDDEMALYDRIYQMLKVRTVTPDLVVYLQARTDVLLDQLRQHLPRTATVLASLPPFGSRTFATRLAQAFPLCDNISIDYAVLEKAADVRGIAAGDFGWNDVGSWNAVYELLERDAQGNSIALESIVLDSHNNFVDSRGKVVALIGVKDLIIVDTPDALLVAARDRAQQVGDIVKTLEQRNRHDLL